MQATIGTHALRYKNNDGADLSREEYAALSLGERFSGDYEGYKVWYLHEYDEGAKKWTKTDKWQKSEHTTHYATMQEAEAKQMTGEETDWGAANISKDDFVNADGSPKSIEEIYNALDPKLPNLTGEPLKLQIRDMLPKYQGVSEEELGFIEEQYGGDDPNAQYDYNDDGVINTLDIQLAPGDKKQTVADLTMKNTKIGGTSFAESISGQAAEASKQADLYGLQKEAGKAGAQMRQAQGSGMGAGMRGAIAGQKSITAGAEQTYDKYGLAKQKADLAGRKARYGLEKGAASEFESEVGEWLQSDWFTTPEGDTPQTSGFRQGGKVPEKGETFLDTLMQLPDAGGS